MKVKTVLVLSVLVPFLSAMAEGPHRHNSNPCKPHFDIHNHARVFLSHGSVYIEEREDGGGWVKITEDDRLIVNDEEVDLNGDQRALVREYRERAESIRHEIGKIASAGAEVGIEGAAFGLKAVGGVFHMVLPGYDSDDFDRDMEEAEAELEAKAESLEDRADRFEGKINELEDLHESMKDRISELDRLYWF
jgi:hypothetical protein